MAKKNKHGKPITGTDLDDIIVAAAEATGVRINAGGGNDDVTASAGDDVINLGDGDDVVLAAEGDDTVRGGDGFDTARYAGSILDFVISSGKGNSLVVEDTVGTSGIDTLKQIEALQFDDFLFTVGANNGVLAVDDTAATDEDTAIAIDVTTNDLDFEGDDFAITAFDATSVNGAAISIDATGQLVYDPSGSAVLDALGAGDTLVDSFVYTVTDAAGNETTGTVNVTVSGVEDQAPSATITFDNGTVVNNTYEESGFVADWFTFGFQTGSQNPFQDLDGDGDVDFGVADNTDQVTNIDNFAWIDFAQASGDAFALVGFDVVAEGGTDADGNLILVGERSSDGYVASATLLEADDGLWDVDVRPDFSSGFDSYNDLTQTEMLDYFGDLESLYIRSADGDGRNAVDTGNGIGIDNIEFI